MRLRQRFDQPYHVSMPGSCALRLSQLQAFTTASLVNYKQKWLVTRGLQLLPTYAFSTKRTCETANYRWLPARRSSRARKRGGEGVTTQVIIFSTSLLLTIRIMARCLVGRQAYLQIKPLAEAVRGSFHNLFLQQTWTNDRRGGFIYIYKYGQTLKIPSANDERALWLQNCPYELRCVIVVLLNSLRSYVCYRIYKRMAANVLKYEYICIKKFEWQSQQCQKKSRNMRTISGSITMGSGRWYFGEKESDFFRPMIRSRISVISLCTIGSSKWPYTFGYTPKNAKNDLIQQSTIGHLL